MQFGKLVRHAAFALSACFVGNCFVATWADDNQMANYLSAAHAMNEAGARTALVAELRKIRDDLRSYALIARGAKMPQEQKAAAAVLKQIKTQISTLTAGSTPDPNDDSQLDPLLFELGSN